MTEMFRFSKDWPYHVSAGAVVFDASLGKIAVLYRGIERFDKESWHLPKGTLENNESLGAAAQREVQEETGLIIDIHGYLGAITQAWVSSGIPINKTTHYFIAITKKDLNSIDDEHDELIWLSPSEAKHKLSIEPKEEEIIVQRALDFKKKFL